ncbi:MAG TPA: hypothetical protein ENI11_03095 [Actinobacteria bacterium]|nr:hypothetical protein [Actinomycetota bacterium]
MIRFKFLLYVALVLFLLVASRFAFRTTTVVTSMCGACHETRAQYAAWKKSVHSNVSCLDCHVKPGLAGYVDGPMRALGSLGAKFTGTRRAVATDVNDDNCLNCHDTIIDDIVIKRGIKVKHREIIDDGRRCGDCHAGVGHKVSGGVSYNRFSSMDKCLKCHRSNRLKKCKLCHTDKPGRGLAEKEKMGFLAHDSEWARRHGVANSRYCRICHDRDFCGECHKIEMPHPPKWPSLHGKQALIQGGCEECHSRKFCYRCHKTEIPHKPGWEHGTQAIEKREICDRCHTDKNCKDCHDLHDRHLLEKQ